MTRLTNIPGIQPIYFLPDDNLAEEVLIPCLSVAGTFDCMVVYFSSRSFAQLAPGLASFLAKPDPWRIDALMLLAIGVTDDTEIIAEPAGVINLANEYAAGGLPDLIDMLKDGDADAIYNLSDNLEAVIKKG